MTDWGWRTARHGKLQGYKKYGVTKLKGKCFHLLNGCVRNSLGESRLMWRGKKRARTDRDQDDIDVLDPNAQPDFLCVGAPKGGTSWLFRQLNSHPDFWMPPLKEVNYFDSMSRLRHPDRAARSNLRLRDDRDRRFLKAMETSLFATPHRSRPLRATLCAERFASFGRHFTSLLHRAGRNYRTNRQSLSRIESHFYRA